MLLNRSDTTAVLRYARTYRQRTARHWRRRWIKLLISRDAFACLGYPRSVGLEPTSAAHTRSIELGGKWSPSVLPEIVLTMHDTIAGYVGDQCSPSCIWIQVECHAQGRTETNIFIIFLLHKLKYVYMYTVSLFNKGYSLPRARPCAALSVRLLQNPWIAKSARIFCIMLWCSGSWTSAPHLTAVWRTWPWWWLWCRDMWCVRWCASRHAGRTHLRLRCAPTGSG